MFQAHLAPKPFIRESVTFSRQLMVSYSWLWILGVDRSRRKGAPEHLCTLFEEDRHLDCYLLSDMARLHFEPSDSREDFCQADEEEVQQGRVFSGHTRDHRASAASYSIQSSRHNFWSRSAWQHLLWPSGFTATGPPAALNWTCRPDVEGVSEERFRACKYVHSEVRQSILYWSAVFTLPIALTASLPIRIQLLHACN